jgi:uncharacterized protein
MEDAVSAARSSVIRTPEMLQVLKDAGVVDAGGHGLYTLLEGALLYLREETDGKSPKLVSGEPLTAVKSEFEVEEEVYGFCTQLLIGGKNLNVEMLREKLQVMGKSLIVVGDDKTVRIHIHTMKPDDVIALGSSYGKLLEKDIRNMDDQHKDFLLMHREKHTIDTGIVAVVNGEGFANVFADLGVSAIIPGGQTMNPSTMDILQAVEAVPSNNVIILPNNKNIVPTASQVQKLTKKIVRVIPTETVPQGVTAVIAFSPDADIDANFSEMKEAINKVRTIEITRANRSSRLNGIEIKEGQAIGILDGKLIATEDIINDLVLKMLSQLNLTDYSIITVYYGPNVTIDEYEGLQNLLKKMYPDLEIEAVYGGQPHYNYIISVE